MNELEAYVIYYFARDLMTTNERRAHQHLLSAQPLTEAEQRLSAGIALEEAQGFVVPAKVKSVLRRGRAGLSDDPEVLGLASGGLEEFYVRTAQRILAEDRDKIFVNTCPSCGKLARTPQARQCHFCGHDWHSNSAAQGEPTVQE
jgi:hypothetical protein